MQQAICSKTFEKTSFTNSHRCETKPMLKCFEER